MRSRVYRTLYTWTVDFLRVGGYLSYPQPTHRAHRAPPSSMPNCRIYVNFVYNHSVTRAILSCRSTYGLVGESLVTAWFYNLTNLIYNQPMAPQVENVALYKPITFVSELH